MSLMWWYVDRNGGDDVTGLNRVTASVRTAMFAADWVGFSTTMSTAESVANGVGIESN